jgi:hypothetical protein
LPCDQCFCTSGAALLRMPTCWAVMLYENPQR